jgi:hypothetical protein
MPHRVNKSSSGMLLVHPPVAKPCEPPAGIARIAGVLHGQGLECRLLDANLEGLLHLLAAPPPPTDTWSRRACRNLTANLAALRSPSTYANQARYQRAVADVNRVLEQAGRIEQLALNFANYQDSQLSPLKSQDLLKAAERPEKNIFYPYFAARLPVVLAESNPAMVGISLNYLSQAVTTFAMAGFLKKLYPGLPLVLGGGLVTSWLRNPGWQNPFTGLIDHLVAGPGEEPVLAMLGERASPSHRVPVYTGLPLKDYLAPGFILPYAAASGCYWNKCSFCPEKAEENPYLPVPPARVLHEIDLLAAHTRPILLHFLDNAISPALMRMLIAQPPSVDWYGFARIGPEFAEIDFCRALRRSGCVMLKLGLESGDQGVLEATSKGISLDLVSRALAALHKAGIATYVYLLFGTPSESIVEARRTLEFVVRHRETIDFLNLAIFNMPVCSAEAQALAVSNFYEADLSLYTDFEHPQGWSRQAIRRFLDTEFKRHPAIAPILLRDPLLFTSNHAPFFCSKEARHGS